MAFEGALLIESSQIKSVHLIDNYTYQYHHKIMNNSSSNLSPKARPLPKFFAEATQFSTKKERETPKLIDIHPPKPPIKSCPPISRLKPQRRDHEGARVISFLNKNSHNDSDLLSQHYDEHKGNLYFEQCFIIEGNLGCGSFGKVYKVQSKEDGKYYAVKKSREKFKGRSDRVRKLEEVAKHEELPPHPNFVKFYRAWEERQRLYIQTELCQFSLSAYAEKHHNIAEETIWQFLIDLLQALKHLHDRNFVHMDIKPDNIFISYENNCKLGDFGLVIDLKKNDLKEVQEGDPKYLAPEVLHSSNNISCAADIFSLGMTILELATDLDLPRGGELWHHLRNGQIPEHLISSLSKDLVEIILKMIEPDHLKRANVDELLNMPKIKKLLNKNKRNMFFSHLSNYFKCIYNRVRQLTITLWYFVIFPCIRFNSYIKSLKNNETKSTNIKLNKSIDNNNNSNDKNNNTEKQNTSTPKRTENSNAPMMNVDDDDDDLSHEQNINLNDSFTVNNNSFINHLMDSSSSFSDNSDFSLSNRYKSMRKNRTEPPLNKLQKSNFLLNLEMSPTSSISPSKTPPWKQGSISQKKKKLLFLSLDKNLISTKMKTKMKNNNPIVRINFEINLEFRIDFFLNS